MRVTELEKRIYLGYLATKEDALSLLLEPLDELCKAADRIRMHFCGNRFDICTIVNAKSGRCSEDCKYCAQSVHYRTEIEEYPLLDADTLVSHAIRYASRGVLRYSIVTSGRALDKDEIASLCQSIRKIKESCPILVCVSAGLLQKEQYQMLLDAGAVRVHNNLETSERFFPHICTTHTVADKITAIRAAKAAGMQICSGGIIGLSETMEDRIDLADPAGTFGFFRAGQRIKSDSRHAVRMPAAASLPGNPPYDRYIAVSASQSRNSACRRPGAAAGQRKSMLLIRCKCRHLRGYAYHFRYLHRKRYGTSGRVRLCTWSIGMRNT